MTFCTLKENSYFIYILKDLQRCYCHLHRIYKFSLNNAAMNHRECISKLFFLVSARRFHVTVGSHKANHLTKAEINLRERIILQHTQIEEEKKTLHFN